MNGLPEVNMDESVEYDPYLELLPEGLWTMLNGSTIRVDKMLLPHLRRTRNICEEMAECANFSNERDKWNEWVELFTHYIDEYKSTPKKIHMARKAEPTRGSKYDMQCACGKRYTARVADYHRGWARSCDKRCAAIRREFGRPEGVILNEAAGQPVVSM